MTEWKTLPLGEALTFQRGFDITKEEQRNGPYPVISSSGPKSTHSEFKVYGPGVVIGRKGSLGTVYYSEGNFWPHDTTLWIKNFHGNHPRFAYYFLQTMGLERLDAGASNPSLNRNHIHTIPVFWPPLMVQRRIAGILSAYDELIENNQRRIRILEDMARNLYRACVRALSDADAIRGVLDVRYWGFVSENVAPYEGTKRYYATADIDGLTIAGAGIDYTFEEKPSRAQKQPRAFSVWFARMKDTYKIAWYSDFNSKASAGSILSSGFAGFQAVEPVFFPFLFLTISSKEFHSQKDLFCTGATQMSLTNEGLSRIQVPVPNEGAVRRLGEQVLPLLNQMLVLQRQIKNLQRTRDLLLPRLLSGQVALDAMEPDQAIGSSCRT